MLLTVAACSPTLRRADVYSDGTFALGLLQLCRDSLAGLTALCALSTRSTTYSGRVLGVLATAVVVASRCQFESNTLTITRQCKDRPY